MLVRISPWRCGTSLLLVGHIACNATLSDHYSCVSDLTSVMSYQQVNLKFAQSLTYSKCMCKFWCNSDTCISSQSHVQSTCHISVLRDSSDRATMLSLLLQPRTNMPKRVCPTATDGSFLPELCTSLGSPVCQYGCSLGSHTTCQQSTGCHQAPSTKLVSAPGPASYPLPESAPWLLLIGPCGGVAAPHPHSWDTANPPCTQCQLPQLAQGIEVFSM